MFWEVKTPSLKFENLFLHLIV